jgi:hypothetical protein
MRFVHKPVFLQLGRFPTRIPKVPVACQRHQPANVTTPGANGKERRDFRP